MLAEQDAALCEDDEEYQQVLTTFNEAKDALRFARVAREFYPVVAPARSFTKVKKKGKGKGKGKKGNRGRGQKETTHKKGKAEVKAGQRKRSVWKRKVSIPDEET